MLHLSRRVRRLHKRLLLHHLQLLAVAVAVGALPEALVLETSLSTMLVSAHVVRPLTAQRVT
jgi:hypothetical protein